MSPEEMAAIDRAKVALLHYQAVKRELVEACAGAASAFRQFTATAHAVEARIFWGHPDVLEADVAAEAWYGEP